MTKIRTSWEDRNRHFTAERSHVEGYVGVAVMVAIILLPVVR